MSFKKDALLGLYPWQPESLVAQDTFHPSQYCPLAARLGLLGKFPIKKKKMGEMKVYGKAELNFPFTKDFVCRFYV